MPDKRISELTAVIAPSGTDEFPCNQGGTTKKETGAQITAAITATVAAHMASSPATHANNSITDALLRDSAGVSVMGRAAAAGGDPADIVSGGINLVLAEGAGGTLAWQQVTAAMLAAGTLAVANFADGTEIITLPHSLTDGAGVAVRIMDDMVDASGFCHFRCPADYVSGGTVVFVGFVIGGVSGNIFGGINAVSGGANGEAYNTHSTAGTFGVHAMTNTQWSQIDAVNISGWLALNDNVYVTFGREGTNGADTLTGDYVYPMVYFTYTANHGG